MSRCELLVEVLQVVKYIRILHIPHSRERNNRFVQLNNDNKVKREQAYRLQEQEEKVKDEPQEAVEIDSDITSDQVRISFSMLYDAFAAVTYLLTYL